jgi:hypothetical protein
MWAVGEYVCFYSGTRGPKRSAQCSKKVADGPIHMTLSKKKEKFMGVLMN